MDKSLSSHKEAVKKRKRRHKQKEWFYDFLLGFFHDNPCEDCGEDDPIVLEFDHVRGKKFMDVGEMVHAGYSFKRILEEIAKCSVVCASCHRRRTAKRGGHARWNKLGGTYAAMQKLEKVHRKVSSEVRRRKAV